MLRIRSAARAAAPALAALAIAAAGCSRRPVPDTRHVIGDALHGVMVFPHSSPLAMAAGDSAGQLTLSAPGTVQDVADWYRENLRVNRWEIESDQTNPDGTLAMYAERDGRPLWIRIQPNAGGPGVTYQLIGAVSGSLDSTAASAQRSGSSMSSNRIQRR